MSLRRITLIAVAIVSALAATLLGLVAWLIATESGTAWMIGQLGDRLPPRVVIAELRGTLLRGLVFRGVVVDIDNDRLEIDEATLELDLSSLSRGSIVADRLAITALSYRRGDPPADRNGRNPFTIPVPITVRDGSVQSVIFVRSEQATELGPVSLRAEAAGNRVVVEDVDGTALGFDVAGRGELVVDENVNLAGQFTWSTSRDGLEYAGAGDAAGAWPRLVFHQELRAPVALAAEGEIAFVPSLSVVVDATWRDLSWPGFALARSPAGSVRLTGWRDDYDFSGSGSLVVEGIVSDVTASGSGTLSDLRFDALHLTGEQGEIDALGRLDFDPLEWTFDIETTDLDPSARLPDWSGALDVTGRLAGRVAPTLELSLSDMTASGELRDRSITATGNVAYSEPNRWQLDGLDVSVGDNEFALTGTLGETVALDVMIEARRLEELSASAAGAVSAAGRIGGTLAEPTLTGTISGRGLRYADYAAETVSASGEIAADETRAVSLQVQAEGILLGDRPVTSVSAAITGTAAQHVAELDVRADYGSAELTASGDWSDGIWSGRLTELRIDQPTVGAWQLTDAARAVLGRGRVELDRLCLAQNDARLCAATRIGTDADSMDVELTGFDLSALTPIFPTELSATGRYDANVNLVGPLTRPAGSFTTHGTGTVFTIRELDEPALDVSLEAIDVRGDISPSGDLEFEALLTGRAGASVAINASVARLWDEERQLSADISGRWEDIGMLSLLSPDVGDVSGIASIDIELQGEPRAPNISGRAQVSNGRVAVPRWGLVVENIDATVTSPDGRDLAIEASGNAGEGRIDVTGVTEFDPAAGWPTQLRVFGSGLDAVRLPDAEILVSPALEIHAALPDVEVTGAFLIPYGRLRLEELPPQAVQPSPDTVVHGVDRPAEVHPLNVHADIRVGLGNDVRYTGAGLDVALSGAMGLVYNSGRDAVASGAVTLSGDYQAYGQTLNIDEGQLLFNGPVSNPNLDVRAVRRIEGGTTDVRLTETITVGVQLSGTVESPVARVFSEPAMSEADALSYLLLGRPLSASGDEETATLESAAFAMGLQQALPVIQRVGETLGLDEFSVQTTTADTGELMAGKRISPRVYIRYTYGLFNRIGGLLMRFSLNDRFSLETRSGDYRSMDLIYTVERD